jgi:hypothetical protein
MTQIPQDRLVVNDLMAFSAEELSEHASNLADEIRKGDYEDNGTLSLQFALTHLIDHVVDIWHLSKTNDAANERESQQGYEKRRLQIPRLQDDYEIVDID